MDGYPKLGNLFASFPELASFRKFRHLSFELLCYKQAEINILEYELENIRELEKAEEGVSTLESWDALAKANMTTYTAQRRTKLTALEKELRTYRQDLLEIAQLETMVPPAEISVQSVQRWLASDNGGKKFLKGTEGRQWWSDYKQDLVAVACQYDTLDRACMHSLASVVHAIVGKWKKPAGDEEKGLKEVWWYAPKHFMLFADLLCVLMSALVPSASILGLFYATTMKERLVMISLFTLAFAGIVLLGFGCRRSETFAATVAFAAVQVVFVESVNNYKS